MADMRFLHLLSLRSMAVLSGAQLSDKAKKMVQRARKRVAKPPAPISSQFLCPPLPLLFRAPNQNRHATQASIYLPCIKHFDRNKI